MVEGEGRERKRERERGREWVSLRARYTVCEGVKNKFVVEL